LPTFFEPDDNSEKEKHAVYCAESSSSIEMQSEFNENSLKDSRVGFNIPDTDKEKLKGAKRSKSNNA
jgi:hypothetical protein